MILQQERLKEHSKDSREISLTLKYFRSHMKFSRQMSNANLQKELTTHLKTLKEHGLVVKDFEEINKKSGFHITFLPLSDQERIVYGYDMGNAIEDHNIINGLGSAVCEVVAEMGKGQVRRIGIQDQFGQSAPYERLLEVNGISVKNIVSIAQELLTSG